MYKRSPGFAAAHLLRETCRTSWDKVAAEDIQRWMVWLTIETGAGLVARLAGA